MLPNFLVPSYKQYKIDSNAVASWLATTAQNCGYPKDKLTSDLVGVDGQTKYPTFKDSDRKLAQGAAKKPPHGDENSNVKHNGAIDNTPEYLIDVKDFVPLAVWIAKSTNPRNKVPASFVSLLDRTISTRKKHLKWWHDQTREDEEAAAILEDSNKSHEYFINILEKVRNVLHPLMPPPSSQPHTIPKDQVSSSTSANKNEFENRFAKLVVEDTSDEMSSLMPAQQSKQYVVVLLEEDLTNDEADFAAKCVLEDIDAIRAFLKGIWKDYKNGEVGLVAASVTTNAAVEFCKGLEEDLKQTFPKFLNFDQLFDRFYIEACVGLGMSRNSVIQDSGIMMIEAYELVESWMIPTHRLLRHVLNVLPPSPQWMPQLDVQTLYGVYEPLRDRELLSLAEKLREDEIILLEMMHATRLFTVVTDEIPAEDDMTLALREMFKTSTISLWAIFSTQIFLDIHHTLREQVSRGFEDLVNSCAYIESNINDMRKLHQPTRIKEWPESLDKHYEVILQCIDRWVNQDHVAWLREDFARRTHTTYSPPPNAFTYFKYHPWHSGLFLFSIKSHMQEVSTAFVNQLNPMFICVHLYNALRQENLMTDAWSDMDVVFSLHNMRELFVGELPKTRKDYRKHLMLASGVSLANFASNRRRNQPFVSSSAGRRKFNHLCPVSGMFKKRFLIGTSRTNLSLEDVRTILQKRENKPNRGTATGEQEIKFRESRDNSPATQESKEGYWIARNSPETTAATLRIAVTPIELLDALLKSLSRETLELSFGYLALHCFCWRLLKCLATSFQEDVTAVFGEQRTREGGFSGVVGLIFAAIGRAEQIRNALASRRDHNVPRELLAKAVDIVKEFLRENGGDAQLQMMKKSLGIEARVPDPFQRQT